MRKEEKENERKRITLSSWGKLDSRGEHTHLIRDRGRGLKDTNSISFFCERTDIFSNAHIHCEGGASLLAQKSGGKVKGGARDRGFFARRRKGQRRTLSLDGGENRLGLTYRGKKG